MGVKPCPTRHVLVSLNDASEGPPRSRPPAEWNRALSHPPQQRILPTPDPRLSRRNRRKLNHSSELESNRITRGVTMKQGYRLIVVDKDGVLVSEFQLRESDLADPAAFVAALQQSIEHVEDEES